MAWHGTRVASIIGGNLDDFRGVATTITTIVPIRVLGACGLGYASDVADAIVWASGGTINGVASNQHPSRIISMSFVGKGACPSYMQSAVTQAITSGSTLLGAAGNDAADSSEYFPANCVGVISVGASTKSGTLASYSNTHVTLAAPGNK
jgi:serine protease